MSEIYELRLYETKLHVPLHVLQDCTITLLININDIMNLSSYKKNLFSLTLDIINLLHDSIAKKTCFNVKFVMKLNRVILIIFPPCYYSFFSPFKFSLYAAEEEC